MKKITFLFYCLIAIGISSLKAAEIPLASGGDINAAIGSANSGDTLLLEDGGLYSPGTINITGGKRITIKAEEGAKTRPLIFSNIRFDANGSSIIAEGLEFEKATDDYFMRTSKHDSIVLIKLVDCVVHGYGRTIIRASEDTNRIDSVIYDNTHFYDFDDNGYQLHYIKASTQISYFKMVNSTIDGFNESALSLPSDIVKEVIIENCTFNNKSGEHSANIFTINGASGSSLVFKNNLFTNMPGTGPLFSIGADIADTIMNCTFYFDETACDTTNTWNYMDAFNKIDPQFIDASNYDLTLLRNSPLLTAGTDSGPIGDPRWVQASLPDGVIAWWKFDETSGTIARDNVEESDGVYQNTGDTLWVDGVVNGAIDFEKGCDSAHIEVAHNDIVDFDSTENFTISALVNIETADHSSDINIVFKGATGVTDEGGEGKWYTMAFKQNELRLAVDDNITKSQLGVDVSSILPSGYWVHVAGVRDLAKDSLYLYMNGKEIGRLYDATTNNIASSLPLIIGNNVDHNNQFKGKIDELQMYNKALSAEEIADLYASYDINPLPEGATAYWKMDDGAGTGVTDEYKTSNGELYNAVEETWTDGYMGKALDFTQSSSTDTSVFVDISNTDAVDFDSTESFSISLLVKADKSYGSEQTIISKGMVGISNGGWYHLSYKNGAVRFMIWDSDKLSSPEGVMPSSFPDNDWVHIVCVRNVETDSLYVYLNGDLLDGEVDETVMDIANDGNLYIGAAPNWGNQLQGSVDELSIYNRVLTADEIASLSLYYGFEKLVISSNKNLADLQVDGTTIDGFSPTQMSYDMQLPAGTTTVPTVTATPEDANASASVTDASGIPGTITITVTAEDGTSLNYTINFTIPSSDAYLTGIALTPSMDLSPSFDKEVFSYTAQLPSGTNSVNVSVTKSDENASVSGDGDIDVSSGTVTATIVVTAEDGSTSNTYSINFSSLVGVGDFAVPEIDAYYDKRNNNLVIEESEYVEAISIYDVTGKNLGIIKNQTNNVINLDKFGLIDNSPYIIRISATQGNETRIKVLKVIK